VKQEFKLDKNREFLFSHETACEFEEAFGDSLIRAANRIGPLVVNHMAWATLRHNFSNNLTHEQTKRLVQKFLDRGGDMQRLIKFLMDGWTDAGVIGRADESLRTLDELEKDARDHPDDPGKDAPSS
jgi:hypothetical protein